MGSPAVERGRFSSETNCRDSRRRDRRPSPDYSNYDRLPSPPPRNETLRRPDYGDRRRNPYSDRNHRNGERNAGSESDEELKGLNYEERRRLKRLNLRKTMLTNSLWKRTPSPPRDPTKPDSDDEIEEPKAEKDSHCSSDSESESESDDSRMMRKKKTKRSKKKSRSSRRSRKRSRSDSETESESEAESESESESESDDSRSKRKKKKTKRSKKSRSKSVSETDSESDESLGKERRSRRKSRKHSRKKSSGKKRKPYSDESESEDSDNGNNGYDSAKQKVVEKMNDHQLQTTLDLENETVVGPMPLPKPEGHHITNYGGAMRPGEGDAIAQFVQQGKRIPRRGEVGLSADEISKFEALGFVMSGNRHQRMNAVRIRKENQVYSAEDKCALAMYNHAEKMKREEKVMADLKRLVKHHTGDE